MALTPQQASIFSTLPEDWQQEILGQINSVGFDAAMQANRDWLNGQDMGNPANAALQQLVNSTQTAQTPASQISLLPSTATNMGPQTPAGFTTPSVNPSTMTVTPPTPPPQGNVAPPPAAPPPAQQPSPASPGSQVGQPSNVPISWPTNGAGVGPTYAGNSRDLGGELGAISAYYSPFSQMAYNNALELNPKYTQLNLSNYQGLLGNLGPAMSGALNDANPWMAQQRQNLTNVREHLNQNGGPQWLNASTYNAATASPTLAPEAAQAGMVNNQQSVQAANNPFLSYLGGQAQSQSGGSPLGQDLQSMARQQLALGGGLSEEDKRNATQQAREAWASRGLINSNGAVAAEILNRDAMSRQRLQERQQFAQGVEQLGQNQSSIANQLGLGVMGGYNTQGALGLQGQMANQSNALNYAQLGTATNQFNAGQQNNMAQFNAGLGSQFALANQNATNQASQFGAQAQNTLNPFNVQAAMDFGQRGYNNALAEAQWNQGNAINPFQVAGGLMGQSPDYMGSLLGFGSDLYNTNYNAQRAAEINAANVSAGKQSGAMGAAGAVAGAGLMALALSCVVARSIFGESSKDWRVFRVWLTTNGSARRLVRYQTHGKRIAAWLKNRPDYRAKIERWMQSKIAEQRAAWESCHAV